MTKEITRKLTSKEDDLIAIIRLANKLYGEAREHQISAAMQLLDELLFPESY